MLVRRFERAGCCARAAACTPLIESPPHDFWCANSERNFRYPYANDGGDGDDDDNDRNRLIRPMRWDFVWTCCVIKDRRIAVAR